MSLLTSIIQSKEKNQLLEMSMVAARGKQKIIYC